MESDRALGRLEIPLSKGAGLPQPGAGQAFLRHPRGSHTTEVGTSATHPSAPALSLPRLLSLTLAACAYSTMVLGAYVKAIGAGMACPQWPSCSDGQFVPGLADPGVAAELAHRTAASLVVVCGIALLALLVTRYRTERGLVALTVAAAATLGVQIALGAITISSTLHPLVVTAHLAVATLFFALTLLVAVGCWRLPGRPASSAGAPAAPANAESANT